MEAAVQAAQGRGLRGQPQDRVHQVQGLDVDALVTVLAPQQDQLADAWGRQRALEVQVVGRQLGLRVTVPGANGQRLGVGQDGPALVHGDGLVGHVAVVL